MSKSLNRTEEESIEIKINDVKSSWAHLSSAAVKVSTVNGGLAVLHPLLNVSQAMPVLFPKLCKISLALEQVCARITCPCAMYTIVHQSP